MPGELMVEAAQTAELPDFIPFTHAPRVFCCGTHRQAALENAAMQYPGKLIGRKGPIAVN